MRCEVCHRPVGKPTVTIRSRNGLLAFGPTCAKKAGLTASSARRRVSLFTRSRPATIHTDQMQLDFQEAFA